MQNHHPLPVSSASKAGSRSSSRASGQPVRVVRVARRAAATVPTWLARMRRRPGWNAPPSERRDLGVAVPAQVEDRALGGEQVEGPLEPGGGGAGVHDEVPAALARRRAGRSRRPAPPRRPRREGSTSTRVTCAPGIRASSRATQQPTIPAPTTATRSPTSGRGVPQGVDRGLDGAGEHRAGGGHVVGHHGHGAGRDDVRGLVRVEAEDRAAAQPGGAALDDADVEVAVLHRPREVALLERRAHRGVLAARDAAAEDQRLGAAADPGAQGADQDVVRPGSGSADGRISPTPGSRSQNARASSTTGLTLPCPVSSCPALNRGSAFVVLPLVPHRHGGAVRTVQAGPVARAGRPAGPAGRARRDGRPRRRRLGRRRSRARSGTDAALARGLARSGAGGLGPADRVTLARAIARRRRGRAGRRRRSPGRPRDRARRCWWCWRRWRWCSTGWTAGSPGAPAPCPRSAPASTWRSTRS